MLKQIAELITANAGLRFREQDYPRLQEIIGQRSRLRGFKTLEDYYWLLVKELNQDSPLPLGSSTGIFATSPTSEWHGLFTALTVNETYFFRDSNQTKLLVKTLLPELIRRKQPAMPRPSLRIWSAGCSTGEELYSIAIGLEELGFPWSEWNTLLIGTDISHTALATARQGIYGEWSFRQTDPDLKQKYFRPLRQSLQVREDIRQRVTFEYGNLVRDSFPSAQSPLHSIDLIICRNVFIYFDQGAIAQTLEKFGRALLPEGYLVTGHTELYDQNLSQFQLKTFPESLVYQRRGSSATAAQPPAANPPWSFRQQANLQVSRLPPTPQKAIAAAFPQTAYADQGTRAPQAKPEASKSEELEAIAADLKAVKTSLKQKAYSQAIRQAEAICDRYPQQVEAQIMLAQAHANIGNHGKAKACCQRALSSQPLNIEIHYLQAQIAEEEGDIDAAKNHLRRVIYLDAQAYRAYLDLASLYQQEGRSDQVRKMQQLALNSLKLLPVTATIDPETGTTAWDWCQHLEKQLSG